MCEFDCLLNFRYPDLVPYVLNRVKLSDPINDSDYVNASWIKMENPSEYQGNKITTCFIASQGPLLNTCPQHLQMIYRNQIDLVVSLTKTDDMVNASKSSII